MLLTGKHYRLAVTPDLSYQLEKGNSKVVISD